MSPSLRWPPCRRVGKVLVLPRTNVVGVTHRLHRVYTMLKIIAIGSILSLCAVGLAACGDSAGHTLSPEEISRANTGAKEFAVNAGDTLLGCNGTDSPPVDDHTTCTLKTKGGSTYPLQCSYKAMGCKPK